MSGHRGSARGSSPTARRSCATRIACVALLAVGACSADTPQAVAARWERYQNTGNHVAVRPLISGLDDRILNRPDVRAYAQELATNDRGRPGAVVDSAHVVDLAGDTANVAVYVTAPNWDQVGGRYHWTGDSAADRTLENPALATTLSRVTEIDTVRLVRERAGLRGRWRVWLNLAQRLRVEPAHWQFKLASLDSPLAVQAVAAREYLRVVRFERSVPAALAADTAEAASIIATGALLDSIRYAISVQNEHWPMPLAGLPSRRLTGWVENLSRRAIKRVDVRAYFTSGETGDALAQNIAPGAREELGGDGDWKGSISRSVITGITQAP